MHIAINDQTSYDDSRVSARLIVRISRATWLGLFLLISYCCIEENTMLTATGMGIVGLCHCVASCIQLYVSVPVGKFLCDETKISSYRRQVR